MELYKVGVMVEAHLLMVEYLHGGWLTHLSTTHLFSRAVDGAKDAPQVIPLSGCAWHF